MPQKNAPASTRKGPTIEEDIEGTTESGREGMPEEESGAQGEETPADTADEEGRFRSGMGGSKGYSQSTGTSQGSSTSGGGCGCDMPGSSSKDTSKSGSSQRGSP